MVQALLSGQNGVADTQIAVAEILLTKLYEHDRKLFDAVIKRNNLLVSVTEEDA